jgi:Holliday junction resolvase RusA-like endonuclease
MIHLHLENERPISWNTFYSGTHWSQRKEEADRVHDLVMAAASRSTVISQEIIKYPVDIVITVGFDKRPLDPDNICSKLYIDGLQHAGLIENDTVDHVHSVTVVAFRSSRPFVTITVKERDQ